MTEAIFGLVGVVTDRPVTPFPPVCLRVANGSSGVKV